MLKGHFSNVNWQVEINKNYTFTTLSALILTSPWQNFSHAGM